MPEKAANALSLNPRGLLAMATILAAAPLALTSTANSAAYRYIQIDVPGAMNTEAYGINDAGQIVGGFNSANDVFPHGFLDTGGTLTRIDAPAGGVARAINNAGQIVGDFGLDIGGRFTQIDVPGATATFYRGINDAGQIVGIFLTPLAPPSYAPHGFLNTGGSFTEIDFPQNCCTEVYGINNGGQIVGMSLGRGFIYDTGHFSSIDVPGTDFSPVPFGINNSKQIVGSFNEGGGDHGFVYTSSGFTQLDVPGGGSTTAYGINDKGEIVGVFVDKNNREHGFLATPGGNASGDPWFTTFSGSRYQFQDPGEFVLSRSTVAGDPFEVEIRDRPWRVGAYGNIISAAAAELCGHRATFDVDRIGAGEGFVWVDGHPSSLSVGHPDLSLGACTIDELSASDYQLLWDTGEMVDVTIRGPELSVSSWYSPFLGPGSVEGLLTTSADPEAWRVDDTASLFDDPPALLDAAAAATVPEPATLTLLAVALIGFGIIRRRATMFLMIGLCRYNPK